MTDSGSSPVKEGDLLAGKYRVERVLGVGGMGVVVAARHEQLDQRVAIKFVRDEALGNEDAVARFLREARAAVKLRSEHAAKVLDVGTLESGAPYMVMEYLEGSDLAAVLSEGGPLPVEVVAEYIAQYKGTASDVNADVAEAYSVGQVVEQAIIATGGTDNASIIKYLHSGVTLNTVQGKVLFNSLGENSAAAAFVFQWNKTGTVFNQVLPTSDPGTKVAIIATKPAWAGSV